MGEWLGIVYSVGYFALVVALTISAILRKSESASALAWSLAIIFIPFAGPACYLLFGFTRMPRRLARRIAHRDHYQALAGDDHAEPEPLDPGPVGRKPPGVIAEDLGAGPLRGGNRVRLFSDGTEAFDDLIQSVTSATHHVHVEFYIFRLDDLGTRLAAALAERAQAGVKVRVLVDGVGTLGGLRLIRMIRRCGGEAEAFLPLAIQSRITSLHLRNHRKLVVCDGRVAYHGGMNVGREYLGRRGGRDRDWYDLHQRIDGPAVWDLQEVFLRDWDFCSGQRLTARSYFPRDIAHPGGHTVRVVPGGPDFRDNPIRASLFAAIGAARERIIITTPYLVPDAGLTDALVTAARAGISVDIVTQSRPPDQWTAYLCGLYYAEILSRTGVQIRRFESGMMHAKAIVIDGVWGMVGTANLDRRSMALNFELMTILEGPPAVELDAELQSLVARCSTSSAGSLKRESWPIRIGVAGARLFAPLL